MTVACLCGQDAARLTKLEFKIMNFASSYALPEGQTITHSEPWDGTAEHHEDGYLVRRHASADPRAIAQSTRHPCLLTPVPPTIVAQVGVRSLVRIMKQVCSDLSKLN